MNLPLDLHHAICSEFNRQGISYPSGTNLARLASRLFEMLIRRIEPVPRQVHLSNEIHDSLGRLSRKMDEGASEAWTTVFYLRNLFECGKTVLPHLSKGVGDTDPKNPDGLLWDYGMHHLHLGRNVKTDGFVERSDWLLFAIVADQDVYFVDVRRHADPERLQWVRQDLLSIAHRNWPELTESRLLRGVSGTEVTNTQKFELRRKKLNVVHEIDGRVIAPLGYGTAADGHSVLCRFLADKLLHELEHQQQLLESSRDESPEVFVNHGMPEDSEMDFKLVCRSELNVSDEKCAEMWSVQGFSGDLWRIGFAIIETNTRSLIVLDTSH